MKLTEPQREHLMELAICTAYQCAETPALVKHGLATTGKSRWCAWAKITTKGQALVDAWPMAQRVALEGSVVNKSVAPALARLEKHLGTTPSRGSRAAPGTPAAAKGRPLSSPGATTPPAPDARRETRQRTAGSTHSPGATAKCPALAKPPRPRGSVKSGATSPPESGARLASDGETLLRGAAPRRRNAAKQAEVSSGSAKPLFTVTTPPTVPLKAGATLSTLSTSPRRERASEVAGPEKLRATALNRASSSQSASTALSTARVAQRKEQGACNPLVGGSSPPTGSIQPNAVRVVIGAKATYYPISQYEQIAHGTKHRVRTSNKFFRAYVLAASEPNDHVFP